MRKFWDIFGGDLSEGFGGGSDGGLIIMEIVAYGTIPNPRELVLHPDR